MIVKDLVLDLRFISKSNFSEMETATLPDDIS